ncbi:SGS domain-containing protein [Mortierella sp. GBAus27b]|nr:Protein SGT1 A [Mortierella sp. GBA43]KAI8357521.1 SGS domain-containing protein [Mortierella sp. GBAus27b]
MSTVQDLFSQGMAAFVDEDYEEAVNLFTKAIEINATHVEIFLKRSTTYQKLGKDKEAYDDAITALDLIKEKTVEVSVDVEAKTQLRKGVAAYHLHDYQTAKTALDACHTLSPDQRTLSSWMRKVDQELAKLPKPVVAPVEEPTPAALGAAAPAPVATPSAFRARHEWYQNDEFVTITIFIKGIKDHNLVQVDFTTTTLSVSVKMPTGSDYSLELDPLSHPIVLGKGNSEYTVLNSGIEIRLKKALTGLRWGALEGDDANASSMATINAAATPAYPTSSKKAKNWDALEKEASKEEDKADGDKALNQLFAQIYKDADDNTKRAMMKSFTESNGTCLSTNWDEVSKGTVETRPPEGMVAKKYNA